MTGGAGGVKGCAARSVSADGSFIHSHASTFLFFCLDSTPGSAAAVTVGFDLAVYVCCQRLRDGKLQR